ncbi:MAG: HIT domain-containing protein [Acidobacteria bacterium]|nr:HIT domain-containing protein [Acidobacteriota bacterium]
MDFLWSPWRYRYVTGQEPSKPGQHAGESGCIFCDKLAGPIDVARDEENFILHRGVRAFILLNLYPYCSGHVMVAPNAHIGSLGMADDATWSEIASLTKRAEQAIQTAYHPDGVNLGMNLGSAAGAGIADHIHMHVLPRWNADTNFMTTIGETRVLPESLDDTYRKLKALF